MGSERRDKSVEKLEDYQWKVLWIRTTTPDLY
jgi:hypothetical protein